jgi:hypothetical protein
MVSCQAHVLAAGILPLEPHPQPIFFVFFFCFQLYFRPGFLFLPGAGLVGPAQMIFLPMTSHIAGMTGTHLHIRLVC